jgi:hypothetical protein
MSFKVAVAEALYNLAILGVKGGVIHPAGQLERPVSCASSEGNGSNTPEPLAGKLKRVCSVGTSSCALTAHDRRNSKPLGNMWRTHLKFVHGSLMRGRSKGSIGFHYSMMDKAGGNSSR